MTSANNTPMVSIIVVNYNGRRFLADCVSAIERNVTVPFEIIMVDNQSRDGSAAFVREHLPQVTLIESGNNLGYARGNNLAVQYARGDHILLLNNDTVLQSDLVDGIRILKENASIGIVGARMLDGDGRYRRSAMSFPTFPRCLKVGLLTERSGPFQKGDFPDDPPKGGYPVDVVEGSFMLMRRDLWDALCGMDEHFFMYGEDVDFCQRALETGYKTVYAPSLSYIHYGGFEPGREHLVVKGILRFHRKHSPFWTYAMVYGSMWLRSWVRLALYLGLAAAGNRKENTHQFISALMSLRRSFAWHKDENDSVRPSVR